MLTLAEIRIAAQTLPIQNTMLAHYCTDAADWSVIKFQNLTKYFKIITKVFQSEKPTLTKPRQSILTKFLILITIPMLMVHTGNKTPFETPAFTSPTIMMKTCIKL